MAVLQRVERSESVAGLSGEAQTNVFPMPWAGRGIGFLYYAMSGLDREWRIAEDTALRGEDYPALVAVWDNDTDAIYDTV